MVRMIVFFEKGKEKKKLSEICMWGSDSRVSGKMTQNITYFK